jgi:four helix bundle protein
MEIVDNKNKFDLEERTAKFGENIIKLLKQVPKTPENIPLINQLSRSATSIGANYCEASEAESKKDFSHKIAIAKKESKETKFWLRILLSSEPKLKEEIEFLQKEAHEFNLIFGKIRRTCDKKKDD